VLLIKIALIKSICFIIGIYTALMPFVNYFYDFRGDLKGECGLWHKTLITDIYNKHNFVS
jgi:hypothetical protein